jgi:hypothetical protein
MENTVREQTPSCGVLVVRHSSNALSASALAVESLAAAFFLTYNAIGLAERKRVTA